MAFADKYPQLDYVLTEFSESAAAIKLFLAEGDTVDIDDIVSAIPDEQARNYIARWLKALQGLYPEMKKAAEAGPFAMLMEVGPAVIARFMGIFK